MAWIRLDDAITEHPKLAACGPLGLAMFVAGLVYCNRNLTDGFIPWSSAQNLLAWQFVEEPDESGRRKVVTIATHSGHEGVDVTGRYVIGLLVDAGLWLWKEDGSGYMIHDYDKYQPTREQVEADREFRIARAKKAANKRWNAKPPAKSNAQPMLDECSTDAPNPNPVVLRSLTGASSTTDGDGLAEAATPTEQKKPAAFTATALRPETVFACCGEKIGYGHADDCDRAAKSAPDILDEPVVPDPVAA